MIPLEEARAHVLARCQALEPIVVPVAEGLGLVLARSVEAPESVPPFDNTAMDGFAVRAADTAGASEGHPARLTVIGTLAAGAAPDREVGPQQAVRIMTGAPMPPGADAIVMVERTATSADGRHVAVSVEVGAGQHVRRAGEDVQPGAAVFEPGVVLGPAHLGVLASIGGPEVTVHRRARVGVISTGDELVQGTGPLEPGQIRDSNRLALLSAVAEAGGEPVDLGWVPDDEDALARVLQEGAESCDALLTSGGVSVGDFDHVKVVLERLGDMRWMQIAIKPAKPFAFGLVNGTPAFGLPGNPVSSLVSFELLARPALRQMMGHRQLDRPLFTAQVEEPLARKPDGKVHFARVVVTIEADGYLMVHPLTGQGSHQLTALADANALAVLPDGEGLGPGATVEVILLADPLAGPGS